MIHTKPHVRAFLTLLVLLALSGCYLLGQATATGTIQGTVTDRSQAVVVGAQVVVTLKATDATHTTTTNETGSYRFDFMPAGTYQVKITKEGFQTVLQTT